MTAIMRERVGIAGVRARYPVGDVTIWRKVKTGEFPAPHYIGSRRYWFLDEVEAWIAQQAARSASERSGGKNLRRSATACPDARVGQP